jgi:N-acetyl-anhydromuramyl-L-alanine amidase AmpD
LILKDGTRHLFNTDNYVLAHAGKSDFNNRNKVNFFSLGIEMEGDSKNGHQFTVAQLESMLEYIRPRIEKYNISLDNITTHKIIRDNYLRKHPTEKGIPKKRDLDDAVWGQLRNLIQKKLYSKNGKNSPNTNKLLGILEYQDSYRKTKNRNTSIKNTSEMLAGMGLSTTEIKQTIGWIKSSAV